MAETIYRLKITLAGTKPAIWRRLETPGCDLETLQELIQAALGWHGGHLWSFETELGSFGMPADSMWDDEDMWEPATKMSLERVVEAGGKRFSYVYDMGDNWEHRILVEKVIAAEEGVSYPRVVKGELACPPEDCGGVWGYADLVEIMRNPKHPEFEERLEWLGGSFDPDRFEMDEANARVAAVGRRLRGARAERGRESAG